MLSSVSTCFSLFLGRLYTLTMLYTLIYRDAISQGRMSVIVDSDALHSTREIACNNCKPCRSLFMGLMSKPAVAGRNRPLSSHSDGVILSRQQVRLLRHRNAASHLTHSARAPGYRYPPFDPVTFYARLLPRLFPDTDHITPQ